MSKAAGGAVVKPTVGMLRGMAAGRPAPSRVQSEGNFKLKPEEHLVRFDPQEKKQVDKRLEEELKKRLVPKPVAPSRAKVEKKMKKKLTVSDL